MKSGDFYDFGPFRLDARKHLLLRDGQPITLTPKALETLVLLVENSGRVLEKDELMNKLWPGAFVEEANLAQNISLLRKALGESPSDHHYVVTVPGRGYRFVAEVRRASEDADELIVEKRTVSRVIVEDTAERQELTAEPKETQEGEANGLVLDLPSAKGQIGRQSSVRWILALAGLGVGLAALLLALNVGHLRDRLSGRPNVGPIRSLAVLPLENLSGDPNQEYFADGMTDELITDLAKIGSLRVISRTSSMRYKRTRKPLAEIARELNVDAVVEGTVMRSGDRVRITAQLIHAPNDRHLWADSYARDFREVLELQDDVARDIAREVKIKLTAGEQARLTTARPVNPEAHEAYLKGRYYLAQMSAEGMKKALKYFEQAVDLDPGYAEGYAAIANCYILAGAWDVLPPREAFPKAKEAADKARALDETLAEAHAALATELVFYEWDWLAADKEIRRSLELNPGYASAHLTYGDYLMIMGKREEALEQARIAQSLDPVSQTTIMGVAYVSYFCHEYDQGVVEFQKALELNPDSPEALHGLATCNLQKGFQREAMEEYLESEQVSGASKEATAELRRVYEKSGIRGYCQEQANYRKAKIKRQYVNPYDIALWSACLEEKDQAFEWLEKAYENRSTALVVMRVDPRLENLHSDPRFRELLKRIGLPP